MHELRGAYLKINFNPCIYNSMSFVIIKKGEIVGPKAHHCSFDNDKTHGVIYAWIKDKLHSWSYICMD